ncbi:hypothetical protein U1Q18_049171, partial [Sarracenia purpurea var. burkii]
RAYPGGRGKFVTTPWWIRRKEHASKSAHEAQNPPNRTKPVGHPEKCRLARRHDFSRKNQSFPLAGLTVPRRPSCMVENRQRRLRDRCRGASEFETPAKGIHVSLAEPNPRYPTPQKLGTFFSLA